VSALEDSLPSLERGDRAALAPAFEVVMEGGADEAAITRFLRATIPFMHDPEAIAIGARALRARMIPLEAPAGAIDVCGTGGDGSHSLNISTAVSFVIAGCGVPVAKHGNRGMSSKTGAGDVLEALGVKLTADGALLTRALREAGVCFLFAQNHHPAMRHVAAARRALGQRTLFNLLGPLSNPAGVTRQLLGVFDARLVTPMAEAARLLGAEDAIGVHGPGGLDELVPASGNLAWRAGAGPLDIPPLGAEDFDPSNLKGGEKEFNAAALRSLLEDDGANPSYRAAVLLNAAAALMAAGRAGTIEAGYAIAEASLRMGHARRALDLLIRITGEAA
jgi:anthranilate phosphoribosyltransferase